MDVQPRPNCQRFEQARDKIQAGLEKTPNQLDLLTIATDVYRASGDRKKSLEYAELLITHHPDNWQGYTRAAQDFVGLNRFDEAQTKIQTGLKKLPNQINLLNIATDVYRASGDHEKSLEYAELLIKHHPDSWISALTLSECLCELRQLEQAKQIIDDAVTINPDVFDLRIKQLYYLNYFRSRKKRVLLQIFFR